MSDPEYVVLDFETTGFDEAQAEIIEIGALRVRGLEILDRYCSLVRPSAPIPPAISRLTGIRDEDVKSAPPLAEALPGFLDFVRDLPLVAHNAAMEQRFLDHQIAPRASVGKFTVHNSIDPLALVLPERPSLSLESLRQWAGLSEEGSHRADRDCEATLRVLERARECLRSERPWVAGIVQSLLGSTGTLASGSTDDPWWWAWFFACASAPLPEKEPLGDLRAMRGEDAGREPDWSRVPGPEAVHRALSHEVPGFRYRETQEKMAQVVRETLAQGGRVAVEAPTGTGKSLAYLVPGLLAARASGAPLVVATHSKSLQDQLLEKDIPLARRLARESGAEDATATTVKGQENYLCLRKLHDHVDAARSGSLEERWSAAYLLSLSAALPTVELDRVSHYLKTSFPALAEGVDSVRSHHTTTLGPPCPYYKRCHFFDSARLAHRADVIVANHALTFQWPAHLPQIRSIVFDEAHHLEEQITEAHGLQLSERTLLEHVHRLDGRSGSGLASPRASRQGGRARSSPRRTGDAPAISRFCQRLALPEAHAAALTVGGLEERCEAIRARAAEVRMAAPLALPRDAGDDGFEQPIVLGPPLPPQARGPAPRAASQGVGPLLEALKNLQGEVRRLAEALTAALAAGDSPSSRQDPAFDHLKTHAFRLSQDADRLAAVVDPSDANRLRVAHWDPRESSWRVSAEPIQVTGLAEPFFAARHGVVLTSATLTTGGSASFVVDRIGLAPTREPVILPSPFRLDRQATVFVTQDAPAPGTPAHLEAITRFTEKAALALGGRTLLLVTANRRLRFAAEALRERLVPHGIEVFDSQSDRRAAEAFRQTERAVLVGGERYGEGLDIPGRALSLVVIEKINEAMTRGPLAEARKARARFPLFDYDFPLRMMWLKQRAGRLIRSATDSGWVVVFDPRYMAWSASSRAVVNRTLAPMPVRALARDEILAEIERADRATAEGGPR